MNLGRLLSLLTSPSLAVAAFSGVCSCAWIVCSFVCICYMPGSVLLSASASAVSVPVSDLLALLSLCLWLFLGHLLLYLFLLCAWICSSVCVCIYCIFVPVPSLLTPLSASVVSVTVPKALKKELINVVFLDSLDNHVQSACSSRFIAGSTARLIALPKICGLYRVSGVGARISGIKCRKLFDNRPSQDNLDTRVAVYIVWKCLVFGLRH